MRVPVIVMVLAATTIPVELRPRGHAALDFGVYALDTVANVAGYVPLGMVLGGIKPLLAIITAALISAFAETGQVVMMHRDPSVGDFAANVIGAMLGTAVSARWGIRSPVFRINRMRALAAATLAVILILGVWATSGAALSTRGATSPGTLEAHWKLDESRGRVALDSSGQGLRGRFSNEPTRVAGVRGGAVRFDGATDYIDFGDSAGFRLVGSMSVSAWINSDSYPIDDAAIVSTFYHKFDNARGYQLDTTIDRGPRTIGFKLADMCGNVVARYGATPLLLHTWYHVAGVYDAGAKTMHVYLNGELDDGFLLGVVPGAHRNSREALYVSRRGDRGGYEFAGSIDDVRIYSLAMTKDEIVAVMRGTSPGVPRPATGDFDGTRRVAGLPDQYPDCAWASEQEDKRIPGAVAALGLLVMVAFVGFWPSAAPIHGLLASLMGGWLLLGVATPTLPSLDFWLFPLTSLAGGASVAVSVQRQADPDRAI